MSELLEVFNDRYQKTGDVVKRNIAHKDGVLHEVIHIWFVNEEGKVLMVKRPKTKKTYPGLWVAPVAGHISAGEDPSTAAVRETKEEIDVDITAEHLELLAVVRLIGKGIKPSGKPYIDAEYIRVYMCKEPVSIDDNLNNEEVELIKWLDVADFKTFVDTYPELMVPSADEYCVVLNFLRNKE